MAGKNFDFRIVPLFLSLRTDGRTFVTPFYSIWGKSGFGKVWHPQIWRIPGNLAPLRLKGFWVPDTRVPTSTLSIQWP
jgi:hypothetical protein